MTRNISGDIADYIGVKELILSFLLSGLFILLSFGYQTRVSTIEITDRWGTSHEVLMYYYGFPFEMIGVLNPLGTSQELAIIGRGLVTVLWAGLFLNFTLYFLLAFILVYLIRRIRD